MFILVQVLKYRMKWTSLSYIHNCVKNYKMTEATEADIQYIMDETKASREFVVEQLAENNVKV